MDCLKNFIVILVINLGPFSFQVEPNQSFSNFLKS